MSSMVQGGGNAPTLQDPAVIDSIEKGTEREKTQPQPANTYWARVATTWDTFSTDHPKLAFGLVTSGLFATTVAGTYAALAAPTYFAGTSAAIGGATALYPKNPDILSAPQPLISTTSRHLLGMTAKEFAIEQLIGQISGGTAQTDTVTIPTADGTKVVTAWAESGTNQIFYKVRDTATGATTTGKTQLNLPGDGDVNFVSGARFGDGRIGICYGSNPSSFDSNLQLVVLSDDGSTETARAVPTFTIENDPHKVSCSSRPDGKLQTSAVSGNTLKTARVDSSATVTPGSEVTMTAGSSLNPQGLSSGFYSSGEQIFTVNNPSAGLEFRIEDGGSVAFSGTFQHAGQAVDPNFDPVTVNTPSGPTTFWRTTSGNIHGGRVNPSTGTPTTFAVATGGDIEHASFASNGNGYVVGVLNRNGDFTTQIYDATTMAEEGAPTAVSLSNAGAGQTCSVGFFPDGETYRISWQDGTNFKFNDYRLNQPPVFDDMPEVVQAYIDVPGCFNVSASDPEGGALTWSTLFNGGPLPSEVTESSISGMVREFCYNFLPGFGKGNHTLDATLEDPNHNGVTSGSTRLEILNRPPAVVSGPTGRHTTLSDTPPVTEYRFPVVGSDLDGDSTSIYLDAGTDPAVDVDGGDIRVTVTPADVGKNITVEYTVEDSDGAIGSIQTVDFEIPDRLPTITPFTFPNVTQGVPAVIQLPAGTFDELDGQTTQQLAQGLSAFGLTYDPNGGDPGGGGLISGTPSTVGDHPVSLFNRQTANGLQTRWDTTITVLPPSATNDPPVTTGNNREVNGVEGRPITERFRPADFSDPETPFENLQFNVAFTGPTTQQIPTVVKGVDATGPYVDITYIPTVGVVESGDTVDVAYTVTPSDGELQGAPLTVTNTIYKESAAAPVPFFGDFDDVAAPKLGLEAELAAVDWNSPLGAEITAQGIALLEGCDRFEVSEDGTTLTIVWDNPKGICVTERTATDSNGITSVPHQQRFVAESGSNRNSNLEKADTIAGLAIASGAVLIATVNLVIAGRVLRYKLPQNWRTHAHEPAWKKLGRCVGIAFKTYFNPVYAARVKDDLGLTFWGGKRSSTKRSTVELGGLSGAGRPGDNNAPPTQLEAEL